MMAPAGVLEPGRIEAPAGQIPFLRLAAPDLFARRAERLRELARRHSLGAYLSFLASLAEAQQQALDAFPPVPLPDGEQQALCREHGMPLLGAELWPRDPAWRAGLRTILQLMAQASLPSPAAEAIARLMRAGEDEIEHTAGKLLAGDLAAVSATDMPFAAAALQAYWTHMAQSLGTHAFGRPEQGGLCPVCGSRPVAGMVRIGAGEQGLRYLSCSLCASEWHMVRIKCSGCESTQGIHYYALEGSNGAVKAESCDQCGGYLKLLYLEKDSRVEALADDLASLGLDLLMDQAGKARAGPNLLFHPGSD